MAVSVRLYGSYSIDAGGPLSADGRATEDIWSLLNAIGRQLWPPHADESWLGGFDARLDEGDVRPGSPFMQIETDEPSRDTPLVALFLCIEKALTVGGRFHCEEIAITSGVPEVQNSWEPRSWGVNMLGRIDRGCEAIVQYRPAGGRVDDVTDPQLVAECANGLLAEMRGASVRGTTTNGAPEIVFSGMHWSLVHAAFMVDVVRVALQRTGPAGSVSFRSRRA